MMPRISAPLLVLLMVLPAFAQDPSDTADTAPPAADNSAGIEKALLGKLINGRTYVSPTGAFSIELPVLPELGGSITDTPNVVTFQDSINTHVSVACFPMDATLRWEEETRGRKEFLTYFFSNFVLADFQHRFAGSKVESARFRPSLADGSLLCFTLLPGGSMFQNQVSVAEGEAPPVAKRGNLAFVKNEHVFIISTELAERVLERSAWNKKPDEENDILSQRLFDLLNKMSFTPPAKAKDAK